MVGGFLMVDGSWMMAEVRSRRSEVGPENQNVMSFAAGKGRVQGGAGAPVCGPEIIRVAG